MRSAVITGLAVCATLAAIGAHPTGSGADVKAQVRDVSSPPKGELVADGAQTPEAIPDEVAYGLLFRMLADRPGRLDEPRTRAYLRLMGLLSADCPSCPPGLDEGQFAALRAALDRYRANLNGLASRARHINGVVST